MDRIDLRSPGDGFKLFEPTEEKLLQFATHLHDVPLNVSDEERTYALIHARLRLYFLTPCAYHLFYEIGDFDGLLGFTDIIYGFKCDLMFKIWNKKAFTHNRVKTARKIIDEVMDKFKLHRISIPTADKHMIELGKLFGFKKEATQKNAFMNRGELMSVYALAKTR